MAPRDNTPKTTPKIQRTIVKSSLKLRSSPATAIKKTMSTRKAVEKAPVKGSNAAKPAVETRQRTTTVPRVSTPKPKENKSAPMPGSVTKSGKKALWKRRPKPAHSGVPVPEKMKKLMEKQFAGDCGF